MSFFSKILIANRGEIALRIIRSTKELGIRCAVVYAENDKNARFVHEADEAYSLGNGTLLDTYLNIEKIIQIANKHKADAIHPGYGFLSENPLFAEACKKNNIVFIGPSEDSIRLMGNKLDAINFVSKLNIPTLDAIWATNNKELIEKASKSQYPLLVKAAAGGGGKGMHIVHKSKDLPQAIETASREALSYFGNSEVYIEKYIGSPRHIEVQILGDKFGNIIHLYDRECSIQRRHQKIIEEAPSPTLSTKTRIDILKTAVHIAQQMNYYNAGTIEFLLDEQSRFYFLEMNTRVQVEHPVTEAITGIDIVKEQIRIAAGLPLSYKQENITITGNAIECRVYAEDAFHNFSPSAGNIVLYKQPEDVNLRVDTSINGPCIMSSEYDPMISKVIAHGANRKEAIQKLYNGLSKYTIHGITTNIDYIKEILENQDFISNKLSTHFCKIQNDYIATSYNKKIAQIDFSLIISAYLAYHYSANNDETENVNIWNTLGYWRSSMKTEFEFSGKKYHIAFKKYENRSFSFNWDNKMFEFSATRKRNNISISTNNESFNAIVSENDEFTFITLNNITLSIKPTDRIDLEQPINYNNNGNHTDHKLLAPLNGRVIKVNIKPLEKVNKGDILMVIESMKMENNILAPRAGFINEVLVNTGDRVSGREVLAVLS